MRAKIANFGLAKTGHNAVTTHIVGTQGYIAPEYLVDGLVTTKMDVFAYGVVLLELVSGREPLNSLNLAFNPFKNMIKSPARNSLTQR